MLLEAGFWPSALVHRYTGRASSLKWSKFMKRHCCLPLKRCFQSITLFNDPKHRSQHCTAWQTENGVDVLDWPSQSPDANPIENVWTRVKLTLTGKNTVSVADLTRELTFC